MRGPNRCATARSKRWNEARRPPLRSETDTEDVAMDQDWKRRDFLSLMGIGGVVFASGLVGCGGASSSAATPALGPSQGSRRVKVAGQDFFFLQLSDTHWGFKGPPNPQADVTLEH